MADLAAAADLAADVAAQGALMATLRKRKAALDRAVAESSEDTAMLSHFQCLEQDVVAAVNTAGPGGMTALLVACLQGSAADVEFLLGFGADPTAEGDVWDVAQVGQENRKKWKAFPLYIAAREGEGEEHAAVVEMLLAHSRVDVNQRTTDNGGATALFIACQWGSLRVVKMLLACDAIKVNQACSDFGETPLYIACYKGHTEIVTMLLARHEIDVNQATTDDGVTPLYIACYHGHTEIVIMLLQFYGHVIVDVDKARTDDGATPLLIACDYGHTEIVKMLFARVEISVNQATTDDGTTPLYIACFRGHTEIVTMLLARDGIDVNQARTKDGVTPLSVVCYDGHTEIVAMLLARDEIEVNKARSDDGLTPLHCAAFHGHLATAQRLTVYGASLTAVDHEGETPAQVAATDGQPVLAEWLTSVAGWSQLRIAAGCRLHKDAALLLRRGRIDPDDPAAASIQDVIQVVATSLAKPAALPWQNAPPICKATIKLVADATRGWHRTTHWLHHKAVRDAVFAVVVVAGRLQTKDAAAAATNSPLEEPLLPILPIEIWLFAMRFFQRSWWGVKRSAKTVISMQTEVDGSQ